MRDLGAFQIIEQRVAGYALFAFCFIVFFLTYHV